MIDAIVALEKLIGLDKAEDIHAFLVDQHVVGCPREGQTCPIAEWLKDVVEFCAWAEVSGEELRVGLADSTEAAIDVTPALQEFIKLFDEECYPDLIDPAWSPTDDEAEALAALLAPATE